MARPVRTSNLLKEAAADHENLDRTAEQERLPVNRVATQPPVQENESVIEKAFCTGKTGCDPSGGFFW